MAYINWDKKYEVGVSVMDQQHMKLFDMINEFYNSLKLKSGNDAFLELIDKMSEYAIYHFSTEQELFYNCKYPEYEEHKNQHDEFIEKIVDVKQLIESGNLVVSIEITDFLKNWITNHIAVCDKKSAEFLVQQGIK